MAEEEQASAGQETPGKAQPAPSNPHRIDQYQNFKFRTAEPTREDEAPPSAAAHLSAEGPVGELKGK